MTDPIDTFTEDTRNVVTFAGNDATRLNPNYVGTEHLLGLVPEGRDIAAGVLQSLGVNLERVERENRRIALALRVSDESHPEPQLPASAKAIWSLESIAGFREGLDLGLAIIGDARTRLRHDPRRSKQDR